jgi:trehalose-phosphatase
VRLHERLEGVRGALIEDKGLGASVHYRLVRRDQVEQVRQVVLQEVAHLPPGKVEIHRGKMVVELRPAIDWDKGRAAVWLLQQIVGKDWQTRCAVIYAGDDRTDEDAFLALGDAAATIAVGPGSSPTAARYMVRGIAELTQVLQAVQTWRAPAPPLARRGRVGA